MALNKDLIKKYNLSDREAEIAVLVLKGLDNGKIAEKLLITLATVKSHIYSIFNKVGVRNRYELFNLIRPGSFIDPDRSIKRRNLIYLTAAGLGVLVLLIIFTDQFLFGRIMPHGLQRKAPGHEKLVVFSAKDLPDNIQSIPDNLDPLTLARWFYHIGSVQKNRELWQQLLTKDDWSRAKKESIWRLLAERGRSYYFVKLKEDKPEYKKYYFQRQVNGKDLGRPGPIVVVREEGKWRVEGATP